MSEKQPKAKPDIYWVTGDQTDSGKTTLAAALIRVLNQNQMSALGFKPYGGANLRDIVDFMLTNFPKTNCAAYGSDALQLTRASPLTSDEDIDLVAPAYIFYYPDWRNCLFARTGSTRLGNIKYYKTNDASAYLERADFRFLLKNAGVPISQSQIVEKLDFMGILELAGKDVGSAFRHLVAMGPDAIVCEGASQFVPTWEDCPPANHVLYISSGVATLHPNVNFSLAEKKSGQVASVRELADLTESAENICSFQISVAPSHLRKVLMERLVIDLLKGSKLIL